MQPQANSMVGMTMYTQITLHANVRSLTLWHTCVYVCVRVCTCVAVRAVDCPDGKTSSFAKKCDQGTGDVAFLIDTSLQSKASFDMQLVRIFQHAASACAHPRATPHLYNSARARCSLVATYMYATCQETGWQLLTQSMVCRSSDGAMCHVGMAGRNTETDWAAQTGARPNTRGCCIVCGHEAGGAV